MPELTRCAWARSDLMTRYHDEEWGVPQHDDRVLFEFLVLEGAQAGLSWETILRKRENYRRAFEGTIAGLAILAAFLPVVSAVGGNASVQAMAVTVRGLSNRGIDRRLIVQLLMRELKVGAVAGACIGALLFVIAMAYSGPELGAPRAFRLGLVVAVAMLANVTLGCVVGTSVPMIMQRLGFDPAQSATIFTTATTDAVGFLLLLTLAATFLL